MKLFDMHCDTLYECFESGKKLRENDLAIDFSQAKKFSYYGQVFALFCGARAPSEAQAIGRRCLLDLPQEERFFKFATFARNEITKNADWLRLCLTANDMDTAIQEEKGMAFLSVEGAELLPDSPDALQLAYDAGVRLLTLTWNHKSVFGGSAARDQNEGLTLRGEQLVRDCEALGIIVDVSHLSDQGFYDVCEIATKPFVASHSNARALCAHNRNLTDDMFVQIVNRKGLVGINLYTPFLVRQSDSRLEDILDHIEHFLGFYGERHLALGCDFDGCDLLPAGIDRQGDLYNLANLMLRKGYQEETINGLFYDNLFSFFHRRLKEKE